MLEVPQLHWYPANDSRSVVGGSFKIRSPGRHGVIWLPPVALTELALNMALDAVQMP